MGGYAPYSGFTEFAIAIGIVLSAIVSLLGSSGRRRAVVSGEASLGDLAELTGISETRAILAVFGPPDMGRIWRNVTLADIRKARTPAGWLMSSDRVDYACIGAALGGLMLDHRLSALLLVAALATQAAGWIAASRIPK